MTLCFSIVCFFTSKLFKVVLNSCLDSGHGGQTKDLNGDEADGYDEGFSQSPHRYSLHLYGIPFPVIYPVDFKRAGHIVDDVSDRAVFLAH